MDNELKELYLALDSTDCFIEQMELQGKIDDIKISIGEMLPSKPATSDLYECVGCGS